MDRKSMFPVAEIQRQNADSVRQDYKEYEAKEVLYVRSDLLNRFRNSPLLERVVVPAAEFEQLCKTRIGRAYVASYQWQTCSRQSLFG